MRAISIPAGRAWPPAVGCEPVSWLAASDEPLSAFLAISSTRLAPASAEAFSASMSSASMPDDSAIVARPSVPSVNTCSLSFTRPEMLIHCMRHTFGTVMARRVPLPVLRDLMGHESIETTMRYVDVSEADKVGAIASVLMVLSVPLVTVSFAM